MEGDNEKWGEVDAVSIQQLNINGLFFHFGGVEGHSNFPTAR